MTPRPLSLPGERSVRRARCLVAYWEDAHLVVENYLSGKQSQVAPMVLGLLEGLDDYRPLELLLSEWRRIPAADDLAARLVDGDLLVVRDSILDRRERAVDERWAWGPDARWFHYSTQRTSFELDAEAQREALAAQAARTPPPSPFTDRGEPDVALPDPAERHGEFWEVLRTRRTRRRFRRDPLSLAALSTVLYWTWGRTKSLSDPALGPYILKTSPSGGARHPIEVYPVVLRVEAVPSGVYHYSVRHHALTSLRQGDFETAVGRACAGQESVRDAAVVFFMTAVVGRSMWKYRQAHAYRVVHLDAGHVGQTFHLVCTRLGLAPFTTAATDNEVIEGLLDLDGITEVAVYVAAAGLPAAAVATEQSLPA